jgi:hypothetical protein
LLVAPQTGHRPGRLPALTMPRGLRREVVQLGHSFGQKWQKTAIFEESRVTARDLHLSVSH